MAPKDNRVLERIEALIEAGEARIITSEHACGAGIAPNKPPFDKAKCAAFKHPVECPLHWVTKPAVTLEGPRPNGQYRAYTAGGVDIQQGRALPLLIGLQGWKSKRLRAARRGTCKPCQAELPPPEEQGF